MARAKRKITTKLSRRPARQTTSQIYEGSLARMELLVAALESRVIADGWHES
jgi:hypothetical protein